MINDAFLHVYFLWFEWSQNSQKDWQERHLKLSLEVNLRVQKRFAEIETHSSPPPPPLLFGVMGPLLLLLAAENQTRLVLLIITVSHLHHHHHPHYHHHHHYHQHHQFKKISRQQDHGVPDSVNYCCSSMEHGTWNSVVLSDTLLCSVLWYCMAWWSRLALHAELCHCSICV